MSVTTNVGILAETSDAVQVVYSTSVTLIDAQIKALPTTGIQTVAAPGANKIIEVLKTRVVSTMAVAYENVHAGCFLNFQYSPNFDYGYLANDAGESLSQVSALLGDGATIEVFPYGVASVAIGYADTAGLESSQVVNKGLLIKAANGGAGNFTGGHASNTLQIVTVYTIVDV